jgi:hypothetical protein
LGRSTTAQKGEKKEERIKQIHLAQYWNQWRALVNMISKPSCSITGREILNFVND